MMNKGDKLQKPELFKYVLRHADSCLILAEQLGKWCSMAPEIEEDIALSNLALDLLGQSRLWFNYAATLSDEYVNENELAFLREPYEFYSYLLVEIPNGNFADTQVRQFFFDSWHYLVLRELQKSNDLEIARIAQISFKETSYHLRRSQSWVIRLGKGTPASKEYVRKSIENIWDYTGELFAMDEIDLAVFKSGSGCDLKSIYNIWLDFITRTLQQADLSLPIGTPFQHGGKIGVHTEFFSKMLMSTQFLYRANLGVKW